MEIKCEQIVTLTGGKWDKMLDINKRVYCINGCAPTINTCEGGHREPKIAVREGTKKGYAVADLKRNGQGIIETTKQYSRPHGFNKGGISESEVFPVVRCSSTKDGNNGIVSGLRIRKLTPKECWRLMGFSDEDVDKASKVVSNSQLYKQAGNSIVVDVLMAIFNNLLGATK